MSYYRAPNKRLIPRTGGGRFMKTPAIDCKICPRCGAINLPTFEGSPFPSKSYPAECHRCGAPLDPPPAARAA